MDVDGNIDSVDGGHCLYIHIVTPEIWNAPEASCPCLYINITYILHYITLQF